MKLEHGLLTDEAERNVILYRHPSQQNRKKENIYRMSQIGNCSQVYNVFLTLILTQSRYFIKHAFTIPMQSSRDIS